MINCHYYHYSDNRIDFLRNNYTQHLFWKPTGFWISKEDSWQNWCKENGFSKHNLNHCFKHKINFKQDLNLYMCNTLDSLHYLINQYNNDWLDIVEAGFSGILFDNYDIIKKCVDITDTKYTWFYGIDVDCCVIWDISKIEIEEIIEIEEQVHL